HTRFSRDWSSDVCSSDLPGARPLDRGGVGADLRAVLGEDRRLAGERLEVAEGVPDVGVLGDEAQRLLLAAAADQHRDAAGRGRVADREAVLDARQVLGQQPQPRARGTELVAEVVVVLLVPARADPED